MGFFKSLFSSIENIIAQELSAIVSSSSGVSQSGAVIAGDVDIKQLTLMSEDRTRRAEILPQVKMIHIYESINQPVIIAELEVEDAIGLHSSFPIIGEEFLAIQLQTPGTESESRYLFRVKGISEKAITENNRAVRYTIYCFSPEYQTSVTSLVQDAPEREAHNIVKDIMKDNIGTTKRVRTEPTRGVPPLQLSNLPPFVAIDLVRRRAKSRTGRMLGGAWHFFENKDGFNFTTLDKMYERGKKNLRIGSDKVFFYDSSPNLDAMAVNARNILFYKQVSFGDNTDAAQEGYYRSSYAGFDLTRGVVENYDFRLGNFDSAAGVRNTSGFRTNREQSTAVTEIVPYRSELNSTEEDAETIAKRNAFVQQLLQNISRITVYGDTNITVGDVIRCNVIEARDSTETTSTSRIATGDYLVSKVKHTIQVSDRSIHTMTMEIIKGSVIEDAS